MGLAAVTFLCDTLEISIFLLKILVFLETSWKGIKNNFCLKFIGHFLFFTKIYIVYIVVWGQI